MTVKEFSKKYNVPERVVWNFIRKLFDTKEKPFVKDENQSYSEEAMKMFILRGRFKKKLQTTN